MRVTRAQAEIVVMKALCELERPCDTHRREARMVVACLLNAGYLKTDDGAGAPPATPGAAPHSAPAGEATSTPAPSSLLPRAFELVRHRDITGMSGTGVVAWGAEWPDKTASLRWATEHPSTVHWDSVDEILAVHGHQGATELRWLDGGE